MKTVSIAGVHINLEHEDLQFKSLTDLKKNEQVFDHLPKEDRATAQAELWETIKTAKEAEKHTEEVIK